MEDFNERFELLWPHYHDGDEVVVGAMAKMPCKFRDLSEEIGNNIEHDGVLLKLMSFKPWIAGRLFCECCIPIGAKVVFRFKPLEKPF